MVHAKLRKLKIDLKKQAKIAKPKYKKNIKIAKKRIKKFKPRARQISSNIEGYFAEDFRQAKNFRVKT